MLTRTTNAKIDTQRTRQGNTPATMSGRYNSSKASSSKGGVKKKSPPPKPKTDEVIYTLKCAKGKYYVGKTREDRMDTRFEEHMSGRGGSAWTSKYKPRSLFDIVPCTGPLHEDSVVRECMYKYGIDNVRGGTYSSVELSEETEEQLEKEFVHADGRCFRCGGMGHFSGACRVKVCNRCGRQGHLAGSCYAKTDVSGRSLEEECEPESDPESEDDCCLRCGRPGHSDDRCYARTHVDGGRL